MVVQVAQWFIDILQTSPVKEVQSPTHEDPPSPVKGEYEPTTLIPIRELLEAKRQAKELEWQKTLETMIQAFSHEKQAPSEEESSEHYLNLRLMRILGSCDDNLVAALTASPLSVQEVSDILSNRGLNRAVSQHAEELHRDLRACCYEPYAFSQAYSAFKSKYLAFASLIEAAENNINYDPETYAKAIWSAFGELVEHPAYLLMRCDDSHWIIRRLHTFALGSQAYCESSAAINALGEAIQIKAQIKRTDSFQDMLLTARTTAANAGFLVNDPPEGSLSTSLVKAKKIALTFINFLRAQIPLSRTLKVVAGDVHEQFFAEVRHYRIRQDNLPGVYYCETFSSDEQSSVRMRVLLQATPTQGAKVMPEFRAMLQAVENRQLDDRADDPYPARSVVYTNLQNKYEGNEGLQSEELMELNDLYPTVFRGITICSKCLAKAPFDEQLPQKMVKILLSDQSFTLKKTTGESNYYFPPSERKKWSRVLPQIVHKAYKVIENDYLVPTEAKTQSFRKLVNSCIIRYLEVEDATSHFSAGRKLEALIIRSCAVCTDRGPDEHSTQLLLTGGKLDVIARLHIANGPNRKGRLPILEKVQETATFGTKWTRRTGPKLLYGSIGVEMFKRHKITTSLLVSPGLHPKALREPVDTIITRQIVPKKLF